MLLKTLRKKFFTFFVFGLFFMPLILKAASDHAEEGSHEGGHGAFAITFLFLAVLLIAAKLGSIVERWGQPAVLGELVIGVILGNIGLLGLHFLDPIKTNELIVFLAELGVVILLFQIGLESNLKEMKKVGLPAFLVAVIGVVLPFVLGTYVVGPLLMPGLDKIVYIFLGATLTATSVGITARVFKDLGKLQTKEARVVLGAAVIDDVLGLLILAVVSALATAGTVSAGSIAIISLKALGFLVLSIAIGLLIAPHFGKLLSKIHTGSGMKFGLAMTFCLVFAYLASEVGLAPIVGAFAAGLLLDPVHFKFFMKPRFIKDIKNIAEKSSDQNVRTQVEGAIKKYSHRHVEDLMEGVGRFLVPLFFVYTGFTVDLSTLFDGKILLIALGVTVVAIFGKLLAGLGAGKANKWLIGVGMIPRGEVGLIFASIGRQLGVISEEIFSVAVVMVILTTLITPPILAYMLKKQKGNGDSEQKTEEKQQNSEQHNTQPAENNV